MPLYRGRMEKSQRRFLIKLIRRGYFARTKIEFSRSGEMSCRLESAESFDFGSDGIMFWRNFDKARRAENESQA